MSSPTILDPEPLLHALDGGSLAGTMLTSVHSDKGTLDRKKLKAFQEDFDPQRDFTEQERENPLYAERQKSVPQWDTIVEMGSRYLSQSGKDLFVALAVVEALTKQHQFGGLRDGLKLLRRLCEECWDRMYPIVDDPTDPADMDGRTSFFNFLSDAGSRPFFPTSVRNIPFMLTADQIVVSFLNLRASDTNAKPKVSQETFRATVTAATDAQIAYVRSMNEDIDEALAEITQLSAALDRLAGKQAPSFGGLREALNDCQSIAQEILRLRGGGATAELVEAVPTGNIAAAPATGLANTGPGMSLGSVRSRDDVYAKLSELTTLLEQLEPHSPVPHVIRRAIEMRNMKFPELVDRLTAEKKVLEFIRLPLAEQGTPG